MKLVRTVADLRACVQAARARGETVGLVPTMGAFHEGHLSLIGRARAACGLVIVSLFVNPAQFTESADLDRYPRDEARDRALAQGAGADILFAPVVAEVYPDGFATTVDVARISEPLEGLVRGPAHFRGVATVVTKLFNMAQPDRAYFGQKDAQQALLVGRLVRDLDCPVQVEVCPTVREADGLAMSSRNVLLTAGDRARAPVLHAVLQGIAADVARGEREVALLLSRAMATLARSAIDVEYLSVVSTETLAPVTVVATEVLVAIAARFGTVRLIDNILVVPTSPKT